MTPYYADDFVTLYHGDAAELAGVASDAAVMLTDPPYGIAYHSRRRRRTLATGIVGDADTSLRDLVLERWSPRPALVFGSNRIGSPRGTRMTLVWDKGAALGMGALDLPWKPSWDVIFVIGKGFTGRRDEGSVIQHPPVQSQASTGRLHVHEKPVGLLTRLLAKCPLGPVFDPFVGSGSTLVAAKSMNRRAIGIEIDEAYCEVAATRLSQDVLGLGA